MILLEPYNLAWKTEFENLKQTLLVLLNIASIDIQHVGSTAIPGLIAKPILDIDIIIENKLLINNISQKLENIGYISKGEQGINGRFAFATSSKHTPHTKQNYTWQDHHLYVCHSDCLALKNHLLFRNALTQDQKLVLDYASMKKELASKQGMTRERYAKEKTDFIISVLKKAGMKQDELDEIAKANL